MNYGYESRVHIGQKQFSYIVEANFIGRWKQSIFRKPLIYRKSLANCIMASRVYYGRESNLKILMVLDTDINGKS